MTQPTEEQREAGMQVQRAQAIVDEHQSKMKNNSDLVLQMRTTKQGYATELEMLEAKGDDVTLEMKYRKVELEGAIKAVGANIDGMESENPNIQHKIDMATMALNSRKTTYQGLVQPAMTGNLSNFDIEQLKQSKPRSKQSHQEKKTIVDKYGMKAYMEYVPMI